MNRTLLSLLQLSDPALPIGGYSHSAGLETYVQQGMVNDVTTAKAFITEMLERSIQYTDAAFVSLSYNAGESNDHDGLLKLDAEYNAVKLPFEMREASRKLGTRLIKVFQGLVKSDVVNQFNAAIQSGSVAGHYSICFGLFAQILGLSKHDTLTGFFYNAAAGFVTNCVKLIPLGQQSGQEILHSLQPLIMKLVENSINPDRELIGLCCTAFDIRSMQHEHLYSRLYMS